MNHLDTLLWFCVTIFCYLLGIFIQKTTKNHLIIHSIVNPAVIAIVLLIFILSIFKIPYATYMQGGAIISFFLNLTTVAFAVEFYKNKAIIRHKLMAIVTAVVASLIISTMLGYYIAQFLGADQLIQMSMLTKSVTTPIAILIAEKIGAVQSLVIMFIFITGIFGAILGLPILSALNTKNDRAIGLALGVVCHGLGVSRAFQKNDVCGLFAVLGMILMGLLSGIMIPVTVILLNR